MPVTIVRSDRLDPLEVVIAGGGVAALEALLALRELARSRVRVTLLAPESDFVYRPLAVAEPFGLARPRRLGITQIAADRGARLRKASLAAVDLSRRLVRTGDGDELPFGALILAIGARAGEALPNALTYRGGDSTAAVRAVLEDLLAGAARRVAFVVPPVARWPLPLYELALLTRGALTRAGADDAEVVLVTHESRPLEVFGGQASERVEGLLRDGRVEVHTGAVADAVADGGVSLRDGTTVPADRVVTLPRLYVPELPGVTQGTDGFIPTDPFQRVEGLSDVYAAGDATWFPVKHGGLAAQQADTAAAAIAAGVGVDVDPRPEPLVLRGALLTGSGTEYLSGELDAGHGRSAAAASPLWWPPGKIAGRYLARYLAGEVGGASHEQTMADLTEGHAAGPEGSDAAHAEALALALAAADADARWGDHRSALRWLDVAEHLGVALPAEHAERRARWERAVEEARG